MSLDQKLKLLRAEHHMTQEYVAQCLNVARSTIAGYETKSRQPSHEKLTALAELFHVSIDYLITGLDLPENQPVKESVLDQEVMMSYKKLSLTSKQDVLKYIRLLELQEKS